MKEKQQQVVCMDKRIGRLTEIHAPVVGSIWKNPQEFCIEDLHEEAWETNEGSLALAEILTP